MKSYLGIPVVNTKNVFSVVRDLGIKPWMEARPLMPLSAWLETATQPERQIYERFGPKPEVQFLAPPEGPNKGKVDIFFRMVYKPWVTTFALIPDEKKRPLYVPLAAEWKQGNRLITLVPPSGIMNKEESNMPIFEGMSLTAGREFTEETGFELENVTITGSETGFYDQVRGTDLRFFAATGRVIDLDRRPTKFDTSEFIKLVLMEVEEWMWLLEGGAAERGFCLESCAATATYLGLRRHGHLDFRY